MRYYSFPLSADQLIKGTATQHMVNIEDSIKEHLDVMLLTWLGAYHHAPAFGSVLRIFHFYMPDADKTDEQFKTFFPKEGKDKSDWEYKVIRVIKNSLEISILRHEKRLIKNLDNLGHETDFVVIEKRKIKRNKIELVIKIEGAYAEAGRKKIFDDFERTFELPIKPPYSKK